MSVRKITKEMYHCTCEAVKSGVPCAHEWDATEIPERCPACKRRTWNRPPRTNRRPPLTAFGKTQTISEWTRELGLSKPTIPWRLRQGWPIEQVLTKEDWRFGEEKMKAKIAEVSLEG